MQRTLKSYKHSGNNDATHTIRPMALDAVHLPQQINLQPLHRLRPQLHLLLRHKLHPKLPQLQTQKKPSPQTRERDTSTQMPTHLHRQLQRPLPHNRKRIRTHSTKPTNSDEAQLSHPNHNQIEPSDKRHRRSSENRIHSSTHHNHRQRQTSQTTRTQRTIAFT